MVIPGGRLKVCSKWKGPNVESLLAKTVPIKPAFPYFDKVAVWLREPADKATLAVLKCGSLDNRIRPGPFPDLRQRLEFKQPKPEALRWLASRPDVYINQVEVALDYEFASTSERNRAYEFLDHGLVRKWHAKQQQIYLDPRIAETRYDAGRGAPNGIVLYKPGYCRFTGEPDLDGLLLHLEWRARTGRAVRAAGIEAGRDLVEFNHRQFWEERLRLYTVDPERLGQWLRSKGQKGRSRKATVEDLKAGEFAIKSVNNRVQELIDEHKYLVRRALRRISIEPFLPG